MGAICLSQAPILRCQSLTRLESGIILIPTAFEIFFCAGVALANVGFDRRHVLLITEGCIYFSLALLDLLVHILPPVSKSLNIFKPLDIFTGVASFIPLLLYILLLYVFTASELIPTLPPGFRALARHILLLLIPLTIAFNELGSFISISYRTLGAAAFVGFTDHTVHVLFDSLALSLLTGYQVLNFCIAFYRLLKAFSLQRRSAATSGGEVRTHMFRGLGWIVAGMLLGTMETVVGFAHNGFAMILARRILRFLGRTCLLIGVVNGVDAVEDFSIADTRRRSMLRMFISNPRNSTFVQLGGDSEAEAVFTKLRMQYIAEGPLPDMRETAKRRTVAMPSLFNMRRAAASPALAPVSAAFSIASFVGGAPSAPLTPLASAFLRKSPRTPTSAPWRESRPPTPPASALRHESRPLTPPASALSHTSRPNSQQRVTVHYSGEAAPVLQLRRFSELQLDPHYELSRARSLPLHVLGGVKEVDEPEWPLTASTTASTLRAPERAVIATAMRARAVPVRHTIAGEAVETHELRPCSDASDAMEVVRALAMQFPEIPRPSLSAMPEPELAALPAPRASTGALVRGSSRRRPATLDLHAEAMALARDMDFEPDRPMSPAESMRTLREALSASVRESKGSTVLGYWDNKDRAVEDTAQAERSLPTPQSMNIRPPRDAAAQHKSLPASSGAIEKHKRARSLGVLQKKKPAGDGRGEAKVRIKSVGSAPRRLTPNPVSTAVTRESVVVEWALISDSAGYNMSLSDYEKRGRPGRKLQKRGSRLRRQSSARSQEVADDLSLDGSFFSD